MSPREKKKQKAFEFLLHEIDLMNIDLTYVGKRRVRLCVTHYEM